MRVTKLHSQTSYMCLNRERKSNNLVAKFCFEPDGVEASSVSHQRIKTIFSRTTLSTQTQTKTKEKLSLQKNEEHFLSLPSFDAFRRIVWIRHFQDKMKHGKNPNARKIE